MFNIASVTSDLSNRAFILTGGRPGQELVGPTGPLGPEVCQCFFLLNVQDMVVIFWSMLFQGNEYVLVFPGHGYIKFRDVGATGKRHPITLGSFFWFSDSNTDSLWTWWLVCPIQQFLRQLVLQGWRSSCGQGQCNWSLHYQWWYQHYHWHNVSLITCTTTTWWAYMVIYSTRFEL